MRHAAVVIVALVLTLAGAGCLHGGKATQPRVLTPKEVVATARATVEQWRQAYEVRSIDALAKLYEQNIDLVVVQEGVPIMGWSSVEGMLKDRLARYKDVHVRLKDIQVQSIAENAAVATATMTRELGDGITTITESGALTIVLRREGEHWLIVTEHYSFRRGS